MRDPAPQNGATPERRGALHPRHGVHSAPCALVPGMVPSEERAMLWGLIVILVVVWLLGFMVVPVGSALIHVLLVIALVVLIYQLVTGRRTL
jgi:hypothetical protein